MVRVDTTRGHSSYWRVFRGRVLLEVCVILNTYIYSGGAGCAQGVAFSADFGVTSQPTDRYGG